MTFRSRIVLHSAAAVAVAIVGASFVIYFVVRGDLRGELDEDLKQLAADITALPATTEVPAPGVHDRAPHEMEGTIIHPRGLARAPGSAPGPLGSIQPIQVPAPGDLREVIPVDPLSGRDAYAQIVTAAGDRIRPFGAGLNLPVGRRVLEVARGDARGYFSEAEIDGVDARLLTQPSGPGFAIQTAGSLEEIDSTLERLAWILLIVSTGGVAIATGLGLLVSRAALRPVMRLATAADEVAATRDLGRRVESATEDELGGLARSFNTMLAALERSLSAQRRLVTDASHELRTPLTSLRTNIEVLTGNPGLGGADRLKLLADVTAQIEELSELVEDLVALARAEEDASGEKAEVRLDELIEGVVEGAKRRAGDRTINMDLEETWVRGDTGGLERAVSNLIDNALKWSPAEGRVDIALSAGELTVTDEGPGIPPEDLSRVFDRFFRSPASRGMHGSGLGLAIVQRVAESHGGAVWAENLDDRGTRLHLRLPELHRGSAAGGGGKVS